MKKRKKKDSQNSKLSDAKQGQGIDLLPLLLKYALVFRQMRVPKKRCFFRV